MKEEEKFRNDLPQSNEQEIENEVSKRIDEILEKVRNYRGGHPTDALTEEDKNFLNTEGYGIDGYCLAYKVCKELRHRFPNSYFYDDIYDESIVGVDFRTGSIIYEYQQLGYLHTIHIEGHYGGLNDRIECGGIVSNRMFRLTPDELAGKIPPSVIIQGDILEDWEYLRGYLFYEHIGGVLADGLDVQREE
jgi:hypothetical protein